MREPTYQDFLDWLGPELREKYISRREHSNPPDRNWKGYLSAGFDWESSNEGFDFWRKIHNNWIAEAKDFIQSKEYQTMRIPEDSVPIDIVINFYKSISGKSTIDRDGQVLLNKIINLSITKGRELKFEELKENNE